MNVLETIKKLIFLDNVITQEEEDLLKTIVDLTSQKLISKLPGTIGEVPKELEYIVIEVSVVRYNRLGSEGMTRESQDGRDITFNANDFSDYEDDIKKYIDSLEDGIYRSRVRFL